MPTFKAPMINLYSRDLSRAAAFYSELGFVETFRTPATGEPVHIELTLDGFTLGVATLEAAQHHHGLQPHGEGRWIEIVLWTDDTDAALNALVAKGAPVLAPAHDFLDGQLRAAWSADQDGNPIQLVQRRQRCRSARIVARVAAASAWMIDFKSSIRLFRPRADRQFVYCRESTPERSDVDIDSHHLTVYFGLLARQPSGAWSSQTRNRQASARCVAGRLLRR